MNKIIRQNIGFDGLLMTDDISMKALSGSLSSRASASLKAGCDVVLHCNGQMKDMIEIMTEIPVLSSKSQLRAKNAKNLRCEPNNFDFNASLQYLCFLDVGHCLAQYIKYGITNKL